MAFKKFIKNFRSVPVKSYQYALLENQEDMEMKKSKLNNE